MKISRSSQPKSTRSIAVGCAIVAMIALAATALSARSTRLDAFARCLSDKKAVMYGSFRCPHCAEQKELFGDSFVYVQYVECSVPFSRQMSAPCTSAQIKQVPTWTFADGQRRVGLTPLEELGQRTGCKLP